MLKTLSLINIKNFLRYNVLILIYAIKFIYGVQCKYFKTYITILRRKGKIIFDKVHNRFILLKLLLIKFASEIYLVIW